MLITDMTPGDTDAVNALLSQLQDEVSGHFDPTKIRQAWRAWVCRDGSEAVVGFLLGSFIDFGIRDESAGTLELLVIDESVRGQGVGTSLVDAWKRWLHDEGIGLAFTSAGTGAVAFYERCGFKRCHGPWLVWVPGHESVLP